MGRQAFRQDKGDGTMEAAGTGGGDTNLMNLYPSEDVNRGSTNPTNLGWSCYWPFISSVSYTSNTQWNVPLRDGITFGYPFVGRETGDIAKMAVRCTVTGTDTCYFGFYDTNSEGYPNNLLGVFRTTSLETASTGGKTLTQAYENDGTTTTDVSLTRGEVYWIFYGTIDDDDIPNFNTQMNISSNIMSAQRVFVNTNAGAYNSRGTWECKHDGAATTLAELMPSPFTELGNIQEFVPANSQDNGQPLFIGYQVS